MPVESSLPSWSSVATRSWPCTFELATPSMSTLHSGRQLNPLYRSLPNGTLARRICVRPIPAFHVYAPLAETATTPSGSTCVARRHVRAGEATIVVYLPEADRLQDLQALAPTAESPSPYEGPPHGKTSSPPTIWPFRFAEYAHARVKPGGSPRPFMVPFL